MPLLGVDLPIDLPIFALTLEISSHHSWPLDASTGGRSASWLANISSNGRNLKSPFLTTRCLHQWGYLLVVLSIWALTVEISSHHSWSPDASTSGIDLPVDLPIWALTLEISSHHSDYWTHLLGGNLPVDQPIWAPRVEISFHYSWLLDASTSGGWSARWSASWSAS